jgi:hypothetical protein
MPTAKPSDAETAARDERAALLDAMAAVLAPLARLAVARGVPFAALEDLLKHALVLAAAAAHPGIAPHRSVSRISTVTGIHRREVTRLTRSAPAPGERGRSLAGEVFTRWLGDRAYRDRKGQPRVLPRQGRAPSFEALAQAVTRDVHPRSLLDELVRLKLARHDADADTVELVREGFVPTGDVRRMLGLLAANAGDHLAAAVDNVLGGGRRHFEQAVFADGLLPEAMAEVHALVGPQWKRLLEELVPQLTRLVEAGDAAAGGERRRVRIGLYAYDDDDDDGAAAPAPAPAVKTVRAARRSAPRK